MPTVGNRTYVDPTNYDRPEEAISEFATEIDPSILYLEMLIGGGEHMLVCFSLRFCPEFEFFIEKILSQSLKKDSEQSTS